MSLENDRLGESVSGTYNALLPSVNEGSQELSTSASQSITPEGTQSESIENDTADIDVSRALAVRDLVASWQTQFSRCNMETPSFELRVKLPFDLSETGLLKLLLQSADDVYNLLDRLEDSGLGIGSDLLPENAVLFEASDMRVFSGTISRLFGPS